LIIGKDEFPILFEKYIALASTFCSDNKQNISRLGRQWAISEGTILLVGADRFVEGAGLKF
jgi:hypothetical protein